jgi:hypothetical protein
VGAASTFFELMAMWKGFFVVWKAFFTLCDKNFESNESRGRCFCEEKVSQKAEKFFSLERANFCFNP